MIGKCKTSNAWNDQDFLVRENYGDIRLQNDSGLEAFQTNQTSQSMVIHILMRNVYKVNTYRMWET